MMAETEVIECEIVDEETQVTALAVPTVDESMSLVRLAIERNVDVEVLERLVALQEHVMERNANSAFIAALARFQDECPPLYKSGKVDFGGKTGGRVAYQFAPLEEIVRVIRPALSANGLSFSHDSEELDGNRLRITCIIRHVDGHSESANFTCSTNGVASPGMNAIQQSDAAVSYGRRYSLIQALGLVTEADTDAHVSAPVPPPKPVRRPPPNPKIPPKDNVQETANKARQGILDSTDPDVFGKILLALAQTWRIDEVEVKHQVKASGATRENPLTQEAALEIVNTMQVWMDAERDMEENELTPYDDAPPPPEQSSFSDEAPYPEEPSGRVAGTDETISEGQRKKLFATMFERAKKMNLLKQNKAGEMKPDIAPIDFALKVALKVDHLDDIPKSLMQMAIQFIERWKP